jgi:hypothetical protein
MPEDRCLHQLAVLNYRTCNRVDLSVPCPVLPLCVILYGKQKMRPSGEVQQDMLMLYLLWKPWWSRSDRPPEGALYQG